MLQLSILRFTLSAFSDKSIHVIVPFIYPLITSENQRFSGDIEKNIVVKWVNSCEMTINMHCVKSVRIRSYSGPHFPAFGLNTEKYYVSFRIQSKYGKTRTRIAPNTETFYAVMLSLHKK